MTPSNRVFIFYRSFSHRKATRLLEAWFRQTFPYEIVTIPLKDELRSSIHLQLITDYDIVILSCGGRDINSILSALAEKKVLTIAVFPGIVSNEQLDAFITRLRCSIVLLNSKKDEGVYKKICKIFKAKYNGLLFGPAWFYGTKKPNRSQATTNKLCVFFGQNAVPHTNQDRRKLIDNLWTLAYKEPGIYFRLKDRPHEKTTDLDTLAYFFTQKPPLENFSLSNSDVAELLHVGDVFLSISSSALLEAMLMNKRVFVVSDFYDSNNHSDFFRNSGVEISFSNINLNASSEISPEWKENNLFDPEQGLIALKKRIEEVSLTPRTIQLTKPNIIWFYFYFPLNLTQHYRKVVKKIRTAIGILDLEAK